MRLLARSIVATSAILSVIVLAVVLANAVEARSGVLGMKLMTAIGLACIAGAVGLMNSPVRARSRIAIALAVIASLIGFATLFEYFTGIQLPIDGGVSPDATGRIGGNTALLLACLGTGIVLGMARSRMVRLFSDGLVLAAAAIAMFALIAYLFGTRDQYPIAAHDRMRLPTAALGIALALAVILLRTDRGVGALFASSTSGGVLARRVIPVLVLVPICLFRLLLVGVEAEVYDAAFAAAVDVMFTVAILVLVVVSSARVVDRLDAVRRGNEAQIRQMVQDVSRHAVELQRSNRELESFSYSVSHDLRAPIRHIAGFMELLEKHAGTTFDDKSKRYVRMVIESAEEAGKLIDELLEFSRMGRAEMATRQVSLGDLTQDAWQQLAQDRGTRAIEFELADLPTVQADPAMLRAVMKNLLSNAIKYSGRQPAATIAVSAQDSGDEIVIAVRDNGVGFDMKYVDKLFGVFQRLHGDEFEGIGIGLANVKRIIERHGGRVWAEGALDEGATFFFSLPKPKGVRT
jgi:signal transduction histidine kinase